MTPAQQFINDRGIMFKVERNGTIVSELKGLPNQDNPQSPKYVGFLPDSDVKIGDWIINSANERLYVSDTNTDFFLQNKSQLKAYYQTTVEHNAKSETPSVSFQIGSATNSVIGNQSHFSMNINGSIQDARERVNSSNSSDKAELHQIIDLLEQISQSQEPIQHGVLSRFASVIQRNSWIASPIASIALNLLLTQIH
ncbi:MAG: hypothetical protein HFI70_03845 [Lachnospiraceae bacterium]|nr:hypothetical protein [Lachnospiraceae bacterium]